MTDEVIDVCGRLAAVFEVREVKFKPQSVKGNRALAMAYIDCRVIQDRLDAVLGPAGWMDDYEILTDGSVVCRLRLKLGGEWVTKVDVGSPSEQPDGGDRLKAAFSDALKRAAVKYGIGRYLYRLPAVWTDYDPQKKQFAATPQLPAWAIPKAKAAAGRSAAPEPEPDPAKAMPRDGAELHRRLREKDAELAAAKAFPAGALLAHVAQLGKKAGYGDDITTWSGPAMAFAAVAVKEFVKQHGQPGK